MTNSRLCFVIKCGKNNILSAPISWVLQIEAVCVANAQRRRLGIWFESTRIVFTFTYRIYFSATSNSVRSLRLQAPLTLDRSRHRTLRRDSPLRLPVKTQCRTEIALRLAQATTNILRRPAAIRFLSSRAVVVIGISWTIIRRRSAAKLDGAN